MRCEMDITRGRAHMERFLYGLGPKEQVRIRAKQIGHGLGFYTGGWQ